MAKRNRIQQGHSKAAISDARAAATFAAGVAALFIVSADPQLHPAQRTTRISPIVAGTG
jgi:hypothetical protein